MSLIKNLFHNGEGDPLIHSMGLMMEAIALHAIQVDEDKHARFQAAIRAHARELITRDITPRQALVATGAAIQTLETFARDTEWHIKRRTQELSAIAGLLAAELTAVCEGNQRAAAGMYDLETQMVAAFQMDQIPALRRKLEQCLATIRMKTPPAVLVAPAFENGASPEGAPVLRAEVKTFAGDQDPVTGLPGRDSAILAIETAIQTNSYAAAMPVVVDRIETINSRFGASSGTEMLLAMIQILAQKLGQADPIFRWQGSGFLVLLQRPGSVQVMQQEMERRLRGRNPLECAGCHRTGCFGGDAVHGDSFGPTSGAGAFRRLKRKSCGSSTR